MVQRNREKEQKQPHINGTENILLRSCTTTGVRKCMNFVGLHKEFGVRTPAPSVEGNARISVTTDRIRDISGIFQNGCGSPVVKVSNHGRYVMSSIPVPLKTRRVGQRCTLNLSRAETSSRWCGVVVRRGGASSGVVHVT
ncbi:uncharacterized protein TNCV_128531 [Trichonephila clavipes]|nr:uncharacterized protein TNCV_128531 [Trichonephila clavipes]